MADSRDLEASKEILYVSFNQTATGLNIGSKTGYTSYDLNTTNEVIPTFDSPADIKDVRIVERVFSTSLIAYVQLEKTRTLVLIHHVKGLVIIEKSFPNTILSVRMNRSNVVVCLEDRIFIISIKNLTQVIHEITNTPTNEKGLIALTYGEEKKPSFLAHPGSSTIGNVQIFDTIGMHAKITIPAHNSALAALPFDESGEKIATASIKGTVIRIFSVAKGEQLYEFRRGVKRCAEINCLSFCKNPELLCVSSNTETIHIFKLNPPDLPQPAEEEEAGGWMDMIVGLVTQSAKLLPTQMSGVLTQQRSFAHVHLPFVSKSTISAISLITPRKTDVIPSNDGGKSALALCQRATRVSLTFRLIRRGDCQCEFPDQCDSQKSNVSDLKDVVSNEKAQELENKYVNQVYEVIADHFSNTRYKPWPKVASFLEDIPPGSVVLDVGCGNGKNLKLTSGCFEMGCDASYNLVQLCSKRNVEAVVADCLALPFRSESIDFVICIAVIHHMSTEARRVKAIEEIIRVLTPKGKALVYVWAFEQGVSKYIKSQSEVIGEGVQEKEASSIRVCDEACLPVHRNRTGFRQQDILVPWTKVSKDSMNTEKVHRFYHVFKQGELEYLILKCGGKVVSSYHDEGNWCAVFEK